MHQITDVTPATAHFSAPQLPEPQESVGNNENIEVRIVQLDVTDLAEPDDDD